MFEAICRELITYSLEWQEWFLPVGLGWAGWAGLVSRKAVIVARVLPARPKTRKIFLEGF